MAPHAESYATVALHDSAPQSNIYLEKERRSERTNSDGCAGNSQDTPNHSSHLRRTKPDVLHDVICVGFGPASLSIAIALHDALETPDSKWSFPHSPGQVPKIAFLERQKQFAWHAGMILSGAKMQISFIKDLATLRNPRSEFTFLNYLHKKGRLLQFTNLGTFLPQRVEYEDYMRWCARRFDDVVDYGQDVFEITPEHTDITASEPANHFTVKSRDIGTGVITERRARHVVIAVGGKPEIPSNFPKNHPRILHSANYATTIPRILPDTQEPCEIAIVGSGQSAAEVFHNLQKRYPNSRTRLLIRSSCLRPSDDSPLCVSHRSILPSSAHFSSSVNEIFDPNRIDEFYKQSSFVRSQSISQDRCTNYGVVRLELLEAIYSDLYVQRLRYSREDQWQHRILNHSTVVEWRDLPNDRVALRVCSNGDDDKSKNGKALEYIVEADVVITATGYRRDAHEDLLVPTRYLLPNPNHQFEIGRDYKVKFREGAVSDNAGVWLQGCNENTHGVSKAT